MKVCSVLQDTVVLLVKGQQRDQKVNNIFRLQVAELACEIHCMVVEPNLGCLDDADWSDESREAKIADVVSLFASNITDMAEGASDTGDVHI
jgi:hypothetical protein